MEFDQPSEPFGRILREILEPVSCDPTEAELLKDFRHSAGVYKDFAKLIEKHPGSRDNLIRVATELKSKEPNTPLVPLSTALSFLGFESARNFLAASIIRKHPQSLLPASSEVTQSLQYAILGEYAVEEKSPLRMDYFTAGLVYDFLRVSFPLEQVAKLIETSWEEYKLRTEAALRIGKELAFPERFQKDLCLDSMLRDVGRIVLSIAETKESPAIPEFALRAEKKRHGFAHPSYGYLLLDRLGFVKESADVILYHHQPFLAARLGPSGWKRATVLWLTDQLAHFRQKKTEGSEKSDSAKPPKELIASWHRCSHPALQIPLDRFTQVLEKTS
jgi:hypothetical protein